MKVMFSNYRGLKETGRAVLHAPHVCFSLSNSTLVLFMGSFQALVQGNCSVAKMILKISF
jgi:hypothetical protein